MGKNARGNLERLRGLLEVTRLVNEGVRGQELLDAAAATVAEAFGFRTVAVNLRQPDGAFRLVTVHGSFAAREALLGRRTQEGSWSELLDRRFEVAGAYFVPEGAFDWESWEAETYVPEIAVDASPDAWRPGDALLVPLRAASGQLIGVLSVDEPESGLRPSRSELALLASVGPHLAQALEVATASEARDRLLAEIEDAEKRYRSLVERLPAVVYRAEIGAEGPWSYVSPRVEQILGYPPQAWLADPTLWIRCVHPEDRERVLATSERTRRTGDRWSREYRMRSRDGRVVWVRDDAEVLDETRGPVVQGVIYDITAQKEAEAAIRHHNELLEQTVRERTMELEAARIETLQRLAFAAEYRDEETHLHTERVGRTAALLGEMLGLEAERVSVLRQAAPLHDIGKLGISDRILLRAGRLNRRQRELMRRHTTIGASILAGSRSVVLRTGEEIALNHHERWDGTGYPRGLRAERIPTSGRIVAVADVFDALTHVRPYKEAWPLEAAVAEILRLSGKHFDPRVVEAFEALDHEALVTDPDPATLRLPIELSN